MFNYNEDWDDKELLLRREEEHLDIALSSDYAAFLDYYDDLINDYVELRRKLIEVHERYDWEFDELDFG